MATDVSVVTPTCRRPHLLGEALTSALSQDGVDVEILVIDDGPDDASRRAVERIDDVRIGYTKRVVPSGGNPSAVRNEGFRRARGRYVHFLDDDDRVAPGAYAAMVAALEAHPHRGVVFGRVEPFGDDPVVLERERAYFSYAARRAKRLGLTGSRRWMVANMLFWPTVLINSACMIRRECVERLGGYDPGFRIVEDVEFYIRAIRRFGCVFLDRTVIHYRTGARSIMHDRTSDQSIVEAYRTMHDRYRATHGRVEHLVLKLLARTVLRLL